MKLVLRRGDREVEDSRRSHVPGKNSSAESTAIRVGLRQRKIPPGNVGF